MYVEALRDYQRDFVATLERSRDAADGVTSAVRTHLRWLRQNPDRAEFLFAGLLRAAGDQLRTLNEGFFAIVTAWLAGHVRAGAIRAASTDVTYALWLGPSQELARLWLARGRQGALRTETTLLADAAWRSLRNDEEDG